MRNPENIDLSKYPPPPGYVVASEGDVATKAFIPRDWMVLRDALIGWRKCTGSGLPRRYWTYLRPITPEDQQGDKYDTDHMFPG